MMKKRFLAGLILLLLGVPCLLKAAPAVETSSAHEGILRLHVIANSDSDDDQRLKLAVRDAILPLFSEETSYEDARAFLLSHGREIQETAERVLRERGCGASVCLSLGTETFPERTYRGLTFPAGEYDALCVRIGAAAGHNWWCVLFPPLCIVSETGEPVDLDELEPESWFLDWLTSLF
jgi:stage II sporulation protein R